MDAVETVSPLRHSERVDLEILELKVQRGLATFLEVGKALLEIKERRLHRITHSSFEKYVHEKFGISESQAYRLLSAGVVVANIKDSPNWEKIANESHARVLAPYSPEIQKTIVSELKVGARKVTAADLERKAIEVGTRVFDKLLPHQKVHLANASHRRLIYESHKLSRKEKIAEVKLYLERCIRKCRAISAQDSVDYLVLAIKALPK